MGSSPSTPKTIETTPVQNKTSSFHVIPSVPARSLSPTGDPRTRRGHGDHVTSPQTTPRSREYTPRSQGYDDIDYDNDFDTSKDELISKVLSAEEFQGQLDDCDRRIKTLCEADERHLHCSSIEACVRLRGHLQDELLRIVAMLEHHQHQHQQQHQQHQHQLPQFLEDFELSNPRIVEILRSLKGNAAAAATNDITIDPIKRETTPLPPLFGTPAQDTPPSGHESSRFSANARDVDVVVEGGGGVDAGNSSFSSPAQHGVGRSSHDWAGAGGDSGGGGDKTRDKGEGKVCGSDWDDRVAALVECGGGRPDSYRSGASPSPTATSSHHHHPHHQHQPVDDLDSPPPRSQEQSERRRSQLARQCYDDEIDEADLLCSAEHRFADEWNGGRQAGPSRLAGQSSQQDQQEEGGQQQGNSSPSTDRHSSTKTFSSTAATSTSIERSTDKDNRHRDLDLNHDLDLDHDATLDHDLESSEILCNLQVKHDEEEADIVKQYTREIVHLDPCEINDVLNSHLLCMQSLRDHQAKEKLKFNQSLTDKRERLLASRHRNQSASGASRSADVGVSSGGVGVSTGRQRTSSNLGGGTPRDIRRDQQTAWNENEERQKFHEYLDNDNDSSRKLMDRDNPIAWAEQEVMGDGSHVGQSLKVEDYSSDSSSGDDDISSKLIRCDAENFEDVLRQHLTNKSLLKCRRDEDKEKFKERLRQRREQLQNSDRKSTEKLNNLMNQLVEYLSDCHANGSLTAEDIKRVIARYRKEQEKIVKINYSDSASNLLLEHQQKSKNLVDFKNMERQKMNAKLKQKLANTYNS